MKKSPFFLFLIVATIFCGCENSETSSYNDRHDKSTRRTGGQRSSGINNLKQIGNALELYTQGSKGRLRPHGVTRNGDVSKNPACTFEVLRAQGHLTDHKVYVIPGGKAKAGKGDDKIAGKNCSYVYMYVGPQYSSASAVAFEKPWHLPKGENYINVLYADGHVKGYKIEGAAKKSCRELILEHPEIFGLYYKQGDPLPTDSFDANRNELD